MFDLDQFADGVRVVDEIRGRIASRDQQTQAGRFMRLEPGNGFGGVEPAKIKQIGELVEDNQVISV
ncbi:MAG: hypothetical protein OXG49_00160 [Chloroflexi bacterium]|nr:hypothetical protein [Chloroflexota bacterium]